MTRPIKFRAKGKSDGQWHYGSLLQMGDGYSIATNKDGAFEMCDVEPETLGQFTGLHDDRSTEIYEGDILYADFMYGRVVNGGYAPDECLCWGVVEFDDINLCWSLNVYKAESYISEIIKQNECPLIDLYLFNEDSGYEYASPLMTVIGNIHDNPELMKGGEQ